MTKWANLVQCMAKCMKTVESSLRIMARHDSEWAGRLFRWPPIWLCLHWHWRSQVLLTQNYVSSKRWFYMNIHTHIRRGELWVKPSWSDQIVQSLKRLYVCHGRHLPEKTIHELLHSEDNRLIAVTETQQGRPWPAPPLPPKIKNIKTLKWEIWNLKKTKCHPILWWIWYVCTMSSN